MEQEIFDDYLAIKYLRNTIVHGKWKEYEKTWLDQRGFPTDTRKLTREHLNKIDYVGQNMLYYIFLTGYVTAISPDLVKPPSLTKLAETVTRWHQDRGILKPRDLNRIIWNNIEKISSVIREAIERTGDPRAI